MADKTRRAFQGGHQRRSISLFQNAHMDFCIAQVARNIGARDAVGAFHPRVVKLIADDCVHFPANLLADAIDSLIAQFYSPCMYTLLLGVALKILMNYNLIGIREINIYGAPLGSLVCYLVSMISAMPVDTSSL